MLIYFLVLTLPKPVIPKSSDPLFHSPSLPVLYYSCFVPLLSGSLHGAPQVPLFPLKAMFSVLSEFPQILQSVTIELKEQDSPRSTCMLISDVVGLSLLHLLLFVCLFVRLFVCLFVHFLLSCLLTCNTCWLRSCVLLYLPLTCCIFSWPQKLQRLYTELAKHPTVAEKVSIIVMNVEQAIVSRRVQTTTNLKLNLQVHTSCLSGVVSLLVSLVWHLSELLVHCSEAYVTSTLIVLSH